jgi:hypothetical protein
MFESAAAHRKSVISKQAPPDPFFCSIPWRRPGNPLADARELSLSREV